MNKTIERRPLGRGPSDTRPLSFSLGWNPNATASVDASCGTTRVLVTASVEHSVPPWMKDESRGWITAEYGMLPGSTAGRMRREAAAGKQSGRTQEIQRLIGRSLRAAINLDDIPGITIRLDCDVIVADGGTRTLSISAAWIALAKAVAVLKGQGAVAASVELRGLAAISLGQVAGETLLDLDYLEDSSADFDLNLVISAELEVIEIQGTAEGANLPIPVLNELLVLASKACEEILELQQRVLSSSS